MKCREEGEFITEDGTLALFSTYEHRGPKRCRNKDFKLNSLLFLITHSTLSSTLFYSSSFNQSSEDAERSSSTNEFTTFKSFLPSINRD